MSNTSRSSQLATGQRPVALGTGVVSSVEHLDADAAVLGQRKQLVIDLEPLGPLGIVGAGDLHQLLIFEARRVAQRAQRVDDALAANGQRDLADMILHVEQHLAERLLRGVDDPLVRCGLGDV